MSRPLVSVCDTHILVAAVWLALLIRIWLPVGGSVVAALNVNVA